MKRRLPMAVAALVLACGSSAPEDTGATTSAIVGGTASDASQNGVVLIMHYDPREQAGTTGCSGALLAPNLVLTARHCVSATDDSTACTAQGKAAVGGKVYSDEDPRKLYVFGGAARPDFLSGDVHPSLGLELLTTGATTLCNADVALIVLDRPVAGAVVMPVRLAGGPTLDEVVTLVGWGTTETSDRPSTRGQRTGVAITAVGPSGLAELGPAEFSVGESTCSGDSGGPAISASGAVVGVVSRGGNSFPDAGTLGAACVGGTNTLTSTAAYADLIARGYARVGQPAWAEGTPNPALGTAVTASAPPAYHLGCTIHGGPASGSPFGGGGLCVVAVLFLARRKCRIGSETCVNHLPKNAIQAGVRARV